MSPVAGQDASSTAGVAVIIPTLNEEASIGSVVSALPRDVVDQIIVADGGSADQTVERARWAGATVISVGRGFGRACLLGAQAAGGSDIVVFMDGDGADEPEFIAALVTPIRSGKYDFVIGSRARGQHQPGSISFHQLAAGHIAGWLIWLLYSVRYSDMCTFRAIRRDTLLKLGMRELSYGWNLEMQMRIARTGLRVLELPVPYRRRAGGESKVAGSLRGTLVAGYQIIATFARVVLQSASRSNPRSATQ
jgi:glycosyltransferase involved in cell wall biosynthesis